MNGFQNRGRKRYAEGRNKECTNKDEINRNVYVVGGKRGEAQG